MRISDWSSDVCSSDLAVTKMNGFKRELGQALIGKAHRLQTAQADGVIWKAGFDNLLFRRDDFNEPFKKPWIISGYTVNFSNRETFSQSQIGRASCRERVCQYV